MRNPEARRKRSWPRYLPYLALPLALAAMVALQGILAVARGPVAGLPFVFQGEAREGGLLAAAAYASGVAGLEATGARDGADPLAAFLPGGAVEAREPGLVVWDRAFVPGAADAPGGGSPFAGLEALKDAAFSGSSVLVGYRAFAETAREDALRDLEGLAGVRRTGWTGAWVPRLEDPGEVPSSFRRDWEAANGRGWDLRGEGLILADGKGRALVLRRGGGLGSSGLRIEAGPAQAGPDGPSWPGLPSGHFTGWFLVSTARDDAAVRASVVVDLSPAGRDLFRSLGLPARFPALAELPFGKGRIWSMLADLAGPGASAELMGPLPAPRLERSRTLDAPGNAIAQFQRVLVPALSMVLGSAPRRPGTGSGASGAVAAKDGPGSAAVAATAFRAGRTDLEIRRGDGAWTPWFVRGVDLGASVPGSWASEPRTDDQYWQDTLSRIADAGFDSVRVYTLLPPAFYRSLARHNLAAARPLWLFQEIWLDEDAPGGDLLEPAWSAAALAESDLVVRALHGRASIAPRKGKCWGDYRIDASPWLAAWLVGRELLPEEVEATVRAHPDYRWQGTRYAVEEGRPVESFLAGWAERVQGLERGEFGSTRPVGLVSWPTLDPIRHPGDWAAGSAAAPYNDRAVVDFRAVSAGPDNPESWFAAFHVYPNYPDFLVRDSRYDLPGNGGMDRYGAYLSDLRAVLPRVPLVIAEFGLATGYGSARIHPEGLDHGGLTEAAQASGLVGLYREIARSGAAGGMVFEWSDEWSKKTWSEEDFMIPFERHALWHNTVDPEENYGILAWEDAAGPGWSDSGAGLRTAADTCFFHVEVPVAEGADGLLGIGLDVVPGRSGSYRLSRDGPLAPQGSEFKVAIRLSRGQVVSARLLVVADYDRASGFLMPAPSLDAPFVEIRPLVNPPIVTIEGSSFPAAHDEGSRLRVGSGGLVSIEGEGGSRLVHVRIPWSRLNVSDPSTGTILLDGKHDARAVASHDSLSTVTIDGIGVWALMSPSDGRLPMAFPSMDHAWVAELPRWEAVSVKPRPKAAIPALSEFLKDWRPRD